MNGVINLLKIPGPSSHQMVQRVRYLLKEKRIGHAGTLDPGAAGVLVLGVGKATRVLEYLLEQHKTYIAEVVFGSSTDTQDSYGKIIETGEGSLPIEKLEEILKSFIGPTKQIPPMASAIKIGGKKLYELMREGIEVDREPRNVVIYAIKIIKAPQLITKGDRVLIEAKVSKGTYIRSLCHDIGQKTGLLAHMGFLLRTKSGGLTIDSSFTVEEIEERYIAGEEFLIPLDKVLDFKKIITLPDREKALKNGQLLYEDDIEENLSSLTRDEKVKVYSDKGIFVGIYRLQDKDKLVLKPEKILLS